VNVDGVRRGAWVGRGEVGDVGDVGDVVGAASAAPEPETTPAATDRDRAAARDAATARRKEARRGRERWVMWASGSGIERFQRD
jgi:hypothetical protein